MTEKRIGVSGSKDFTRFYKNLDPDEELKNYIDKAMDSLKESPSIGNKIQNKLWPKGYVKKYGINNLWRYSLGSNWRMIYTILSNGKDITCVILEVLTHVEYDERFGYQTS